MTTVSFFVKIISMPDEELFFRNVGGRLCPTHITLIEVWNAVDHSGKNNFIWFGKVTVVMISGVV